MANTFSTFHASLPYVFVEHSCSSCTSNNIHICTTWAVWKTWNVFVNTWTVRLLLDSVLICEGDINGKIQFLQCSRAGEIWYLVT